jgi:glycine cleavage system transcriptional repressor
MEHLVILAHAPKGIDLHTKLCAMVTDVDCYITEAYGTTLGTESMCSLLVTGNWNNIAKLETTCNKLSDNTIRVLVKRTERSVGELQSLPYSVQVIAPDQVGLAANVCRFFSDHRIPIENFQAETYLAYCSNTPMQVINISICIPPLTLISELREQFLVFCEDLNLDGILEPERK